ncbi:MAG TPA: hypothetical protein VGB24_23640 [Longimicrobium sp.]|jgi:hypothetical protein|uniref:hypothetical protein n=1 Tax=Longimicrobium sp. TaxID=2029185 RepID=UPI002ED81034
MTIKSTPNQTPRIYRVRNITQQEEERILDFLQGAVYLWCKDRPADWFGLRDFMGGANKNWHGTALQGLYDRHAVTMSPADSSRRAAIDGGRLLKRVLHADAREFEARKGYRTAEYRMLP